MKIKSWIIALALLSGLAIPALAKDDTSKAFKWKPNAEHKERSGPFTDKSDMRRTRGPEGDSLWQRLLQLLITPAK